MIPSMGCNPKINIVSIGAKLLEKIQHGKVDVYDIFLELPSELQVSIDHIILSLDWLFIIKAISFNGNEVCINETE